jgi:hypothetical protein
MAERSCVTGKTEMLLPWRSDSLLGSDRETNKTTGVAMQRKVRQWTGWKAMFTARSAPMAAHATMDTMSGFSVRSVPRCYKWDKVYSSVSGEKEGPYPEDRGPRVEAGSNTSAVTLRVVGGEEKGSLESETVNNGHESHGTRTPE